MENEKEGKGRVTNLEYLLKLSKGNGEFVRDMIRIFLEETPGEVSTLESAIATRDYQSINAAAHKLRSTVPFVGIDKMISSEISEIEHLAKDKVEKPERKSVFPTDQELIARIERLFTKIKQVFTRAYDELRTNPG